MPARKTSSGANAVCTNRPSATQPALRQKGGPLTISIERNLFRNNEHPRERGQVDRRFDDGGLIKRSLTWVSVPIASAHQRPCCTCAVRRLVGSLINSTLAESGSTSITRPTTPSPVITPSLVW